MTQTNNRFFDEIGRRGENDAHVVVGAHNESAIALYLRAGQKPPADLVNSTTEDTTAHVAVPSVLLTPEWVTTANMNSTIVKDKFVPVTQLCSGNYATDCKAAGITP